MIRTPKAREVLTQSEFDLYLSSLARSAKDVSPARLKQKVVRARKLRDKYRGQADRQRREERKKAAPRGSRAAQGNERTRVKQQIFSEVLERYEAALKAVPKAASKARKAAPGSKKKVARKPAGKKKAAKKTAKKKAAKKKAAKKKAAKRKVSARKLNRKKGAKKPAARKPAAKKKAARKPVAKKKAARKPAAKKKATKKKAGKKKAAKKAARKKAAKKPAAWKRGKTSAPKKAVQKRTTRRSSGRTGKVSQTSKSRSASAKARVFERSGRQRTRGHTAARGRRSQARRDSGGGK